MVYNSKKKSQNYLLLGGAYNMITPNQENPLELEKKQEIIKEKNVGIIQNPVQNQNKTLNSISEDKLKRFINFKFK
jgi:hypothetical protein